MQPATEQRGGKAREEGKCEIEEREMESIRKRSVETTYRVGGNIRGIRPGAGRKGQNRKSAQGTQFEVKKGG